MSRLSACLLSISLAACGGSSHTVGSQGGACTQGGACDTGLVCTASHTCEATGTTGCVGSGCDIGTGTGTIIDSGSGGSDMAGGAKKLVFVTHADFQIGQIGSLTGGDALCLGAAEAANLPGHYQAWLSDSHTNAIDHVTGTGPWYTVPYEDPDTLVTGQTLAFATHDALKGDPQNGILIDETSSARQASVWTGTIAGGTALAQGSCSDWGSTSGSNSTVTGESGLSNDGWTNLTGMTVTCDNVSALYCFEE